MSNTGWKYEDMSKFKTEMWIPVRSLQEQYYTFKKGYEHVQII